MSDALPLAAASARLRGKPGRPRKPEAPAGQASAPASAPPIMRPSDANVPATCPPRLLDVEAAARYLSVSTWTIRDLVDAGELKRVRLTAGRTEVRRLLLDRLDLDRLVDRSRDA